MNNMLNLMRSRLTVRGGLTQQDRMIKDKRDTLDKATLYSYQGAKIFINDSNITAPALINPNIVKQDYDDKIVSVGFEYEIKPGSVFAWLNTNTYWLVYLQDLTELAYFKGNIRRCKHQIKWKDEKGNLHSSYMAIRGPVETKIDTAVKSDISFDFPNHSLNILIPKNEDTMAYFKRYSKFYIVDSEICWRVEATDDISMPGILEVNAIEYYSNDQEDKDGVVGELVVEPIPPVPQDEEIKGETFIRPKKTYDFVYEGADVASWSYDTRLPIRATENGKSISIYWDSTYRGQFILKYGDKEKTIVVESLF